MDESILKLEKQGNVAILALTLDSVLWDDNEQLKRIYAGLLQEGTKSIILDLSKTGYVSSIVLASFVYMFKMAKDAGGTMVLCGLNSKVKELLSMTNLDKVLDLAADRHEALARLLSP